jgi:hypothetical protein
VRSPGNVFFYSSFIFWIGTASLPAAVAMPPGTANPPAVGVRVHDLLPGLITKEIDS